MSPDDFRNQIQSHVARNLKNAREQAGPNGITAAETKAFLLESLAPLAELAAEAEVKVEDHTSAEDRAERRISLRVITHDQPGR